MSDSFFPYEWKWVMWKWNFGSYFELAPIVAMIIISPLLQFVSLRVCVLRFASMISGIKTDDMEKSHFLLFMLVGQRIFIWIPSIISFHFIILQRVENEVICTKLQVNMYSIISSIVEHNFIYSVCRIWFRMHKNGHWLQSKRKSCVLILFSFSRKHSETTHTGSVFVYFPIGGIYVSKGSYKMISR